MVAVESMAVAEADMVVESSGVVRPVAGKEAAATEAVVMELAGMVGGGRVAAAMVQVKRVQERKVALVMAAAETVVAVTAEE